MDERIKMVNGMKIKSDERNKMYTQFNKEILTVFIHKLRRSTNKKPCVHINNDYSRTAAAAAAIT